MMKNSRIAGTIGIVVVAIVGLFTGMAVAGTSAQQVPAGVSASPDGSPAAEVVPDYPINASGETYGAADQAVLPEHEPDLILAIGSNGREGYISKAELDELIGANVATPEEAVRWQLAQDAAGWDSIEIPLFESDGLTQIGMFEVTRSVLDYPDSAAGTD